MDTIIIKQDILILSVFLLWTAGLIDGDDVTQTPILWIHKGDNATIHCNHNKGGSYLQMYWYRQLPGEAMKLIVFTTTANNDHDFGDFSTDKFSAIKTVAESGSFTVKHVVPADKGLYFCAVIVEHIKMIVFFCITFNVILVSGLSLSDQVHQTPADMYKKPEEQNTKITCSHSIQNYNQILWYKQNKKQLQLLGYMLADSGTPETGVDVKIEGSADKDQNCTLTIERLSLNSSAVYFCAARNQCDTGAEAYFGKGTKLTVLESNYKITAPTVTVLPPSQNECQNPNNNQKKKTLVCVATNFYPDHVSVDWKINEKNVTKGVATDNAALRKEKDSGMYNITSRLKVSLREWYNPSNTFECIVRFYNGKEYENVSASITGEEGMFEPSAEKYLKITQSAKLSYSVFIAKSCIYGAFVVFLVWKLQGKHN
ncbi:hypothetical protein PAMP_006040 [Pampus punctatissimus]